MIGLLLAAVLLKPVFAFECFCADPGHGVDVAAIAPGGEDCCLGQDCGDCCAHVTAVVPLERPLPLSHTGTVISTAVVSPYRPRPAHGVFRPPIAA